MTVGLISITRTDPTNRQIASGSMSGRDVGCPLVLSILPAACWRPPGGSTFADCCTLTSFLCPMSPVLFLLTACSHPSVRCLLPLASRNRNSCPLGVLGVMAVQVLPRIRVNPAVEEAPTRQLPRLACSASGATDPNPAVAPTRSRRTSRGPAPNAKPCRA